MQDHLAVYQRTGEPCLRCGRPIRRIVVGGRATHFCSWCQRLPAADRPGAPGDPPDDGRARSGRAGAGPSCPAGRGASGRARRARPRRAASRSGRRRAERTPPGGRDPPRRRARVRGRLIRCRSSASTASAARSARSSSSTTIDGAIAVDDRIGLVGPNGAGKTTLLRLAAGRDEPDDGEVHRKRGLTIGLLAQESHFDAAFMAAPDLRAAVRHGAAHLEAMAAELARARAGRPGRGAAATPTSSTSSRSSAATPSTSASTRRCPGLGFTRDEWAKPPTALSGGEQTRATLARLVIAAAGPAVPRRADEPPRHRRDRVARGAPPPAPRRAPRRVPRPGVPRRDRQPDLGAPRPEADGRSAATTAPTTASARSATRGRPRTPTRQADQIAREKELVQRYRSPPQVQQDARARGAAREAPGRAGRRAEGDEEAPPAGRRPRRRRPVAIRRDRDPGRGPRRRLPAGARRRDGRRHARDRAEARRDRAVPGRDRAATGSGSSGRTGRARRPSSGRSPATCRRSTGR